MPSVRDVLDEYDNLFKEFYKLLPDEEKARQEANKVIKEKYKEHIIRED